MPIVSNTSPILNLAIIGQLDLLRQQFAEVLIPSAVQAELKPETTFPGATAVQQALQAEWLRVAELKDVHLARALALDLDEGEAAAIALALELGAKRILMDEHNGAWRTLGVRIPSAAGTVWRPFGKLRAGSDE